MKLSVPTLNRETSRLRTDGRLLLPNMTGIRENALWYREIMTCKVHVPPRKLDTALPRTWCVSCSVQLPPAACDPCLELAMRYQVFECVCNLDDLGHQEGATGDSTSMVTRRRRVAISENSARPAASGHAHVLRVSASSRASALCATFVRLRLLHGGQSTMFLPVTGQKIP